MVQPKKNFTIYIYTKFRSNTELNSTFQYVKDFLLKLMVSSEPPIHHNRQSTIEITIYFYLLKSQPACHGFVWENCWNYKSIIYFLFLVENEANNLHYNYEWCVVKSFRRYFGGRYSHSTTRHSTEKLLFLFFSWLVVRLCYIMIKKFVMATNVWITFLSLGFFLYLTHGAVVSVFLSHSFDFCVCRMKWKRQIETVVMHQAIGKRRM